MKYRFQISATLTSEKGLGPIALALGLSAAALLASLGSLAISRFHQVNLAKQNRIQIAEEINKNALVMTAKLIKTQDFIKNPATKIWSAPSANASNPLWKFAAISSGNFGVVNYSSCDPSGMIPSSTGAPSASLSNCSKLNTKTTFLSESNGRPRLQIVTQLGIPTNNVLNAILIPPPTVDLKGAVPSGVASNGPLTINSGQAITLSWTSTGADSCTLSPGGYTGTQSTGVQSAALVATTQFDLTCTNSMGSVRDSLVVNVTPADPCLAVVAAPDVDFALPPVEPIPALPPFCGAPLVIAGSPQLINDANGLKAMANGQSYKLATNIILPANWVSKDIKNIILDGGGFAIRGATTPIFRFIEGSIIKNLAIRSPNIRSTLGGALGGSLHCSTLNGVKVIGGLISGGGAGFVSGARRSIIANSGNSANVCGQLAGGLSAAVGAIDTKGDDVVQIIASLNRGEITGTAQGAGGLVGGQALGGLGGVPHPFSSTIIFRKVWNSGQIRCRDSDNIAAIGGIMGYSQGIIIMENAVNDGMIRGHTVGGIMGRVQPWLWGSTSGGGYFVQMNNVKNMGEILGVTPLSSAGGILGYQQWPSTNSNNNEHFIITNAINDGSVSGLYVTGGIVGQLAGAPTRIGSKSGAVTVINNGNVSSTQPGASGAAAGIVGRAGNSNQPGSLLIKGVANNGYIRSSRYAGGIFGDQSFSSMSINIEGATNRGGVCSTSTLSTPIDRVVRLITPESDGVIISNSSSNANGTRGSCP